MSTENNRNFEDLKKETEKFRVSTGEEKQIVMMVDDDEIHLEMTKHFLEEDYDVVAAKSCEEALRKLYQGHDPDLFLLDIVMPESDGWRTFERIRGISKLHNVPIAFFTASDDPADREHAKKVGAVDYIKKPCERKELLDRIQKILAKSA